MHTTKKWILDVEVRGAAAPKKPVTYALSLRQGYKTTLGFEQGGWNWRHEVRIGASGLGLKLG